MDSQQTSKSSAQKRRVRQSEHKLKIAQGSAGRYSPTQTPLNSSLRRDSCKSIRSSQKSACVPLNSCEVSCSSKAKEEKDKANIKEPKQAVCSREIKARRYSRARAADDAYLRNKVKTASGGELVIMLYEKAISNLSIAYELLAQPNATPNVLLESGTNIRNAKEIILELLYSLDLETGGEFARKMSGIYGFMNRELTEALIEKTGVRLTPIIEQLKILLEAWRKAHEQIKSQEQLEHPDKEDLQIGSQ